MPLHCVPDGKGREDARTISLPTPYTILMVVIALAAAATWLLPAGTYDTLRYDESAPS